MIPASPDISIGGWHCAWRDDTARTFLFYGSEGTFSQGDEAKHPRGAYTALHHPLPPLFL